MSRRLDVLIIEDSESDARTLVRELRRSGFSPEWERVETATALRDALRGRQWSLVISGSGVRRLDVLEALAVVKEEAPTVPFILVAATILEEKVVQAIRSGANALSRDNLARLGAAVSRETSSIALDILSDRRLLEVRDAERRRVAHELHDKIGQLLVAVRLNVLAAQRRRASKRVQALAEAKALVDDCIERVRDFASYLYPAVLGDGLGPALETTRGQSADRARPPLTQRQHEVLQLIVRGHSTRAIARQLQISVKTVETHRAQLMDRLGIYDIASLVLYAVRTGIVRADI